MPVTHAWSRPFAIALMMAFAYNATAAEPTPVGAPVTAAAPTAEPNVVSVPVPGSAPAAAPVANPEAVAKALADFSYAAAFEVGKGLAQQLGNNLNPDAAADGLRAALDAKASPRMTDAERKQVLETVGTELRKQKMMAVMAENTARKQAGETYLADNGKKPGVLTLPSGLQVEVLSPAAGPKPKDGARVKVRYEGRLTDGTLFDRSPENGEPVSFGMDQVIPGFREGLAQLNEGSKARLFIPSQLGYGDRQQGTIPAASVLVFDVELVSASTESAKPAAKGAGKRKPRN